MGEAVSFEQAIETWDSSQAADVVAAAEAVRASLVERFPLDAWPTMPLEHYALGQGESEDAFCWWLEFNTPELGSMRGGSALKLIIYKRKSGPGWYFPSNYPDEQAAWTAVRAGFVQAFELAQSGQFDEIDTVPALLSGQALRCKATYLYFPDQLLPVYSKAHIDHFLHSLDADGSGLGAVASNRKLLAALRERGLDWPTTELGNFLYWWNDPRSNTQIVKIAPGENARLWSDCEQNGYICVGWDDVGNLAEFESNDDFVEAFATAYPYNGNKGQVTRKARELWTLRGLEPGDIVIANRGTAEICGIGTVIEPGYAWRPERPEYKHTVSVEWQPDTASHIDPVKAWATTTVKPVAAELYHRITKGVPTALTPGPADQPDPMYVRIKDALEHKGQVILYGPPGTGKTYHARRFVTWWLNSRNDDQLTEKEWRAGWSVTKRRAWFVVANPSNWAWEELFEEGWTDYPVGKIAKNYTDIRPGDIVFGYEATPSLRIAAIAMVSEVMPEAEHGEPGFYVEPLARVAKGATWDEMKSHSRLKDSEPIKQRCQGTLFKLTDDETEDLWEVLAEHNPGLIDETEAALAAEAPLTMVSFHPSYAYEDFVEGFRPAPTEDGGLHLELTDGTFKRICRTAALDPTQPYVLIVDEINRGNVPKIFGELITLIEADKRADASVVLPQSREDFNVPANVWIVATMNTADRSVHLLDAALRRRFGFVELMPDLDVLAGASVGSLALDVFLGELNRRIVEKAGREMQIGQSYFFEDGAIIDTAEQFARVFRHELLPLLQEYCYEDYGDLAGILGDGVIDADAERPRDVVFSDPDGLVTVVAAAFGATSET